MSIWCTARDLIQNEIVVRILKFRQLTCSFNVLDVTAAMLLQCHVG